MAAWSQRKLDVHHIKLAQGGAPQGGRLMTPFMPGRDRGADRFESGTCGQTALAACQGRVGDPTT